MVARLVTLGDSLTHGFQSGAISRPQWSYPAIVARALAEPNFRYAPFDGGGFGGPLVDFELLLRRLSDESRRTELRIWDLPGAALSTIDFMSRVEDYWERGPGTERTDSGPRHHNLGVWGFDVLDTLTLSDAVCYRNTPPATNQLINQIPEFGMYRSARRVFNPSQAPELEELVPIQIARQIATQEGGIETLIVALGQNNVLGTCVRLELEWSQSSDLHKLSHQRSCTIWNPEHFEQLYRRLSEELVSVGARHTVVGTIPHVTVVPLTRGVSPRARARGTDELHEGYYEYYTRFWIWDDTFNPSVHEHFTREDAMKIDSTIDEYNKIIRAAAKAHGFVVIDFAEILDQLAFRRQKGKPTYEFPPGLVQALKDNPATAFRVRPDGTVLLDSRYLTIPERAPQHSDPSEIWQKAYRGGLFGLDGAHPTTIGYGLMAYAVLATLRAAGVPGADPNQLPWKEIVRNDSLVLDPPALLTSLQQTLNTIFSNYKLARAIEKIGGYAAEAMPKPKP